MKCRNEMVKVQVKDMTALASMAVLQLETVSQGQQSRPSVPYSSAVLMLTMPLLAAQQNTARTAAMGRSASDSPKRRRISALAAALPSATSDSP